MKQEMCVYSGRQQGKQEPYNETVYFLSQQQQANHNANLNNHEEYVISSPVSHLSYNTN
jgi:hypothetical protein